MADFDDPDRISPIIEAKTETEAKAKAEPEPAQVLPAAQDKADTLSQHSHHTDDPNDPSNWPEWHKRTTYYTICLFSFIANVNASNFTVATLALRKYFHIDATHAVYLTALNVLMFGMGNLLWIPMMRVTGKRPVYLLAILVLIFSNVWSARAGSYSSLLVSRMVSGIGASAADATVPSAVAEMWDGHTRGKMMMYFHFALASGIFLGPLINAYVVQEYGWRWSPAWIAMASGLVFILAFFLIHETQYQHDPETEFSKDDQRKPFVWYLSLRRGFTKDHPVRKAWQTLKDIFVMASYPPILFASCVVGLFVGWTIIIQVSLASTYLQPPYSWSLGLTGLLHLAGWLGALTSLYFGGRLIDWLVRDQEERKRLNDLREEQKLLKKITKEKLASEKLATKRLSNSAMPHDEEKLFKPTTPDNTKRPAESTTSYDKEHTAEPKMPVDKEIQEPKKPKKPESRLLALIIPFLIAPPGLLIYGICLAQDDSWIGPAFGYAMHSFGFVAVSNIVVTNAVDNYKAVAGEAMVPLFIVRNVIAVVCSIYCFPWIQRDGLKVVFGIMAGLEWALMLAALPLYLYGDRIRKFTGSYGPMKRLRAQRQAGVVAEPEG